MATGDEAIIIDERLHTRKLLYYRPGMCRHVRNPNPSLEFGSERLTFGQVWGWVRVPFFKSYSNMVNTLALHVVFHHWISLASFWGKNLKTNEFPCQLFRYLCIPITFGEPVLKLIDYYMCSDMGEERNELGLWNTRLLLFRKMWFCSELVAWACWFCVDQYEVWYYFAFISFLVCEMNHH